MQICVIEILIYFSWVNSLKERRSHVKSLIERLKNKFNISVLEEEDQNAHKKLELFIVFGEHNRARADSYAEKILGFTEKNTEGEVVKTEKYMV